MDYTNYTTEHTKNAIEQLISQMERTPTEKSKEAMAKGLTTFFEKHYGDGIYGTGTYGDLYRKFKDICSSTIPEQI